MDKKIKKNKAEIINEAQSNFALRINSDNLVKLFGLKKIELAKNEISINNWLNNWLEVILTDELDDYILMNNNSKIKESLDRELKKIEFNLINYFDQRFKNLEWKIDNTLSAITIGFNDDDFDYLENVKSSNLVNINKNYNSSSLIFNEKLQSEVNRLEKVVSNQSAAIKRLVNELKSYKNQDEVQLIINKAITNNKE